MMMMMMMMMMQIKVSKFHYLPGSQATQPLTPNRPSLLAADPSGQS
jgi:hypothetical protein